MLEYSWSVLNGVRLMLKGSGAETAYICMEDNKPEAAKVLQEALEAGRKSGAIGQQENIQITVLPTKYPQGGERQLIDQENRYCDRLCEKSGKLSGSHWNISKGAGRTQRRCDSEEQQSDRRRSHDRTLCGF